MARVARRERAVARPVGGDLARGARAPAALLRPVRPDAARGGSPRAVAPVRRGLRRAARGAAHGLLDHLRCAALRIDRVLGGRGVRGPRDHAHGCRARDGPLLLRARAASHRDQHPPRERTEPARRREARVPRRGRARAVLAHRGTLGGPPDVRPHGGGGARGAPRAMAREPWLGAPRRAQNHTDVVRSSDTPRALRRSGERAAYRRGVYSPAGLAALGVVGLWLAYLVPHRLRHRQQLLESRTEDRYSGSMRVLAVTDRT